MAATAKASLSPENREESARQSGGHWSYSHFIFAA
jgi:hypothetical protein